MTDDPQRLLIAALALLAWLALCAFFALRERARRRAAADAAAALGAADGGKDTGGAPVLVAFASQTGFAEQLAWQTARWLRAAGLPVRLSPLGQVGAEQLAGAGQALFVVSTYGEGDPPDNASSFARAVMGAEIPLAGLRYAVLALGDRSYANFCGFGRGLDAWLVCQGARPLFERIDVDNAGEPALNAWRDRLRVLTGAAGATDGAGGTADGTAGGAQGASGLSGAAAAGALAGAADAGAFAPAADDPFGDGLPDDGFAPAPFSRWRVCVRRRLNPGSLGEPMYHLELRPADDVPLPEWQAGDLVQLRVPADPGRPRDYSIASLPADGALHLLVRLHRREDGTPGLASRLLAEGSGEPDERLELRIRPHRGFRLEGNETRPLLLVGNGSGFAGLRALLKARAAAGAGPNWLVFGERQAAHDELYRDEVGAWLAGGVLEHADRVFSRDAPQGEYVQDRLERCADRVRAWVADGAAIYVCGSLQGMAAGVDAALARILGREALERLRDEGRYRRDVY